MSIVKSVSVGNGDTFYIKHNSDNFTMIDCCLDEDNKERITDEIIRESKEKRIHRFISTHPDEDHILGLKYLNSRWKIINFYVVKNEAEKKEETESFDEYCILRDNEKAFYIHKGCKRRWMNQDSEDGADEQRESSEIHILWPNTDNDDLKEVLESVKECGNCNNLSPIILYRGDISFMWMGDIQGDFLDKVKDDIEFEEIDVLFAPHHGRKSGHVPKDVLVELNPQIIVVGEAPSKDLDYYSGYNTITQNSSGDIIFDVYDSAADVYVGNSDYSVNFLKNMKKQKYENYIGSFQKRE